jgi:hypothetical protein
VMRGRQIPCQFDRPSGILTLEIPNTPATFVLRLG